MQAIQDLLTKLNKYNAHGSAIVIDNEDSGGVFDYKDTDLCVQYDWNSTDMSNSEVKDFLIWYEDIFYKTLVEEMSRLNYRLVDEFDGSCDSSLMGVLFFRK